MVESFRWKRSRRGEAVVIWARRGDLEPKREAAEKVSDLLVIGRLGENERVLKEGIEEAKRSLQALRMDDDVEVDEVEQ